MAFVYHFFDVLQNLLQVAPLSRQNLHFLPPIFVSRRNQKAVGGLESNEAGRNGENAT
jgi:hypothetical protein